MRSGKKRMVEKISGGICTKQIVGIFFFEKPSTSMYSMIGFWLLHFHKYPYMGIKYQVHCTIVRWWACKITDDCATSLLFIIILWSMANLSLQQLLVVIFHVLKYCICVSSTLWSLIFVYVIFHSLNNTEQIPYSEIV